MKIEISYPLDNETKEFLRLLLGQSTPSKVTVEVEQPKEKPAKKEKLIKAEPEKITVEQLRKAAKEKGDEVGRDKVVKVIKSFNAENLGEIVEEDYEAFLEKINTL